jgi:hydrogenase nickel incorporation protein HypA/HybF
MIDLMTEYARCARVKRIVLEVGKLTAVLPDAIRFCFKVCSAETVTEGAELEIVERPGQARCRACGRQMIVEESFGCCRCGRVRHSQQFYYYP